MLSSSLTSAASLTELGSLQQSVSVQQQQQLQQQLQSVQHQQQQQQQGQGQAQQQQQQQQQGQGSISSGMPGPPQRSASGTLLTETGGKSSRFTVSTENSRSGSGTGEGGVVIPPQYIDLSLGGMPFLSTQSLEAQGCLFL
jgi:hypothetical protein